MSAPHDLLPSGKRLTSWKEIASYLDRDVRTVQRWEKNEGLPVHRHLHDSRSSVYVHAGELDAWLANRAAFPPPAEPDAPPLLRSPRVWVFAALVGLMAVAVPFSPLWKSSDDGAVRIRQLLNRSDIDGVGAPSWDGRFVPYRNNKAEMMLYDVETGQSRRVLDRPASVRQNFLLFIASPDGSRVAYLLESMDGPGQLRILNTDGSGDRVLFTDPKYSVVNPRSWSADGQYIAAALWEADGTRDVGVISVADGSLRVLYGSKKPPTNARFSPDGRFVAYNEAGDVFVVPSGGGPPIGAVVHRANDALIGWAPDGRLAFSSDRSGTRDIWGVAFHDGKFAEAPQMLWKDLSMTPLGITEAGDLLYSRSTLLNELYTVELDSAGHLTAQPARLPGTRYEGRNRVPDYSRDGKFLAYVSGSRDSPAIGIRIRTLATGEERELPLPMPRVDNLRWYPDSGALLIRGGGPNSKYGLYRLDLNETEQPLVPVLSEGVPEHQSVNPMFSPDGKYLYYLALPSKDVSTLMRLNLASGVRKEVLRLKEGFLRMYSLSPDGTQIVFDARTPGAGSRDRLYVAPLSGGEPRLLTEGESARASGGLAWANARTILFHRPDPYGVRLDDLLRVPLDGGPSEKLASTGVIMNMAAHPGGQRIIWESQDWNEELSVIHNLFPRP